MTETITNLAEHRRLRDAQRNAVREAANTIAGGNLSALHVHEEFQKQAGSRLCLSFAYPRPAMVLPALAATRNEVS